jgi:hypothetical protein
MGYVCVLLDLVEQLSSVIQVRNTNKGRIDAIQALLDVVIYPLVVGQQDDASILAGT